MRMVNRDVNSCCWDHGYQLRHDALRPRGGRRRPAQAAGRDIVPPTRPCRVEGPLRPGTVLLANLSQTFAVAVHRPPPATSQKRIFMEQRYATSPEQVPGMDAEQLRRRYLVQDLFVDDQVKALYSHHDRIVLTGASPVAKTLVLATFPQIRSDYFFARREGGIVNVGGTGTITVDGRAHRLTKGSCLYIGRGARDVAFASAQGAGARTRRASPCCPHRPTLPTRPRWWRPVRATCVS